MLVHVAQIHKLHWADVVLQQLEPSSNSTISYNIVQYKSYVSGI